MRRWYVNSRGNRSTVGSPKWLLDLTGLSIHYLVLYCLICFKKMLLRVLAYVLFNSLLVSLPLSVVFLLFSHPGLGSRLGNFVLSFY